MRALLFTMRMSGAERARVERVARHYGLNAAGVVRLLLKREDDAITRDAGARQRRAHETKGSGQ